MNALKLMLSIVACCIIAQSTIAQKTGRTLSLSQMIANGADETAILKSWENLVLQKQIKTYNEAERLAVQTMQKAFLQGNKHLASSITKTAYYSTLTIALSKEVGAVKAVIQKNEEIDFSLKNFKIQPNARDMQRIAGVGKLDLVSQRKLRFNLVNKALSILDFVPGFQSKGHKVSGKNKRQAILPNIFIESDVVLSKGKKITTKKELDVYLNRLVEAYKVADTNLKTSGTQLKGITMMQQHVAQREATLNTKMLKKAASIID